jgi:hypothetical protein
MALLLHGMAAETRAAPPWPAAAPSVLQEAADADFFSSAAPGGEAADAGNGEAAMVFAEPTTEDPRIAWAK